MDRSFAFLPRQNRTAGPKEPDDPPVTVRKRLLSIVYDVGETVIYAIIIIALLFTFVVRLVGVHGDSMKNTLQTGDRLLLWTVGYTPQYGDIVVVDRYAQEPLIKRVIALEGDIIDIDPQTGKVTVNGSVLNEPYISTPTDVKEFQGPQTVPQGMVFVMGDNRLYSNDSRKAEIGFVEVSDIVGRAVFRVWPLNDMGSLLDR